MQTFQFADYTIVCQTVNTRNGFKHVATLLHGGNELISTKICYQNRTWERFTYESVISQLLSKAVKEKVISSDNAKALEEYIASKN